jgi:hypothetical protein
MPNKLGISFDAKRRQLDAVVFVIEAADSLNT